MRLVLMMVIQATQVVGPPIPKDPPPVKLVAATAPCGEPAENGDIVVCGRAKDADRLPRIDADRYVEAPVRAETGLFGKARVSLEAEQGSLSNGQTSTRAMVRLKMPF